MNSDPQSRSNRRFRASLAAGVAAVAIFVTGGAIAITDAVSAPPATRQSPQAVANFFCVAVGNFGICVGPPTA